MKIPRPRSKQPMPTRAKKVFCGKLFDTYQWEQVMFDGSIEIFEKIKRPDTVNIIAITGNDKILVLEQEQPGEDKFLGLPGGRIDEGEDALTAAKRELLEETGCESSVWELWDAVQPYSKSDWACYTFIAKRASRRQDIAPDKGERIKVREVDLAEFLDIVYSDEFRDKEVLHRFIKEKARQKNNPAVFEMIKHNFFN